MTRLRRLLIVFVLTAAFMAAVIVFVSTPPRPLRTTSASDAFGHVRRGAFHIHTVQSDGALDREQIALAASRAGLHFAIFTDHGDGTRPANPPEYLHGVLCIDGVEISTNQGHYVALGLTAAPYPLGGDADAVVEDVIRLGGFGIAAHPFSPRGELNWSDWNVPIDGIEWLNADTQWRDESKSAVTRALLGYLTRPGGALASLLDRPEAALAKLDELAATRHVVAVAGHDAHGGFGEETGTGGRRLHLPSYESAFRTFSVNVQVSGALKGRAVEDAGAVLEAIRRGRVFTAVDAIASPAALDFRATDGPATAMVGDVLPDNGHEVTFVARAAMPVGASLVLLHDGTVVRDSSSNTVEYSTKSPGSYRVEVRVPGAPGTPPVPWIVSSPIFRLAAARLDPSPAPAPSVLVRTIQAEEWRLEKGGGTTAAFSPSDGGVTLSYRLGTNPSPYAALATDLPSEPGGFSHVVFKGRASKPMRISAQLRFSADGAIRWRRPVFLETRQSSMALDVSAFRAADRPGKMPDTNRASSVLFVIDTTNAKPGDEGSFTIQGVELRR